MYILEIKVAGEWETYQFPTVEKVLDYVYMVEGEGYLPEYRNEFQRNAPSTLDIKAVRRTRAFHMWQVGAGMQGDIKYYLSWTDTGLMARHRRIKYNFPKLSKFWGTVYGLDSRAETARVEKAAAMNAVPSFDDYHMGVN